MHHIREIRFEVQISGNDKIIRWKNSRCNTADNERNIVNGEQEETDAAGPLRRNRGMPWKRKIFHLSFPFVVDVSPGNHKNSFGAICHASNNAFRSVNVIQCRIALYWRLYANSGKMLRDVRRRISRLSRDLPPWSAFCVIWRRKAMRASQVGSIEWTSLSCIFILNLRVHSRVLATIYSIHINVPRGVPETCQAMQRERERDVCVCVIVCKDIGENWWICGGAELWKL